MTWKQINPYFIQNGLYTIAKVNLGDKFIYSLWRGDRFIARFNSSDEAIKHYDELENWK